MVKQGSQYEKIINNTLPLGSTILKVSHILLQGWFYHIFKKFSRMMLSIGIIKVPLYNCLTVSKIFSFFQGFYPSFTTF